MSLDALHPFAGNHAIQSVAFVLEWPGQLDADTIRAIHGLASKFRSDFPVVQLQEQVTFQFDARVRKSKGNKPASSHSTQSKELGGVQFTCPAGHVPGQVSRMIRVDRANCVIVVNDYSRWETVWGRVKNWLSVLLPVALGGRALSSVTLQYHDLFYWKADPATLDLRELFVPASPYLPPNCYDRRGAWHSHHGFLDQTLAPFAGQVLDNINVNIADVNGERQIGALLTHKMTLDSPVWTAESAAVAIEEIAIMLHARNKGCLDQLLADAVKEKIGLLPRTTEA